MTSLIINPADVPNGDQIAGSSSFKCNENCEGCLCEKHPCRIIEACFAKKRVETVDGQENQYRVYFDAIDSANPQSDNQNNVLDYDAMLGKTVYLIIETEHMPQQPIRFEIRCAELGENSLEMMWFNGTSYAIGTHFEARVGNFDALNNNSGSHAHYTNLSDYEQYAIVKLQLRPNTRETFNSWVETIDGGSVNFQVQAERVNGDCIYEDEQKESSEPYLFLTGTDRQFRVVNRNFYVIYHGSNEYNFNSNETFDKGGESITMRCRIYGVKNNQSEQVIYYYYDNLDNEYFLCCRDIITIINKRRQINVPQLAARGRLTNTISYAENRRLGEDIDARTLEIYENGTLGIHHSSDARNSSRDRWYANQLERSRLVSMEHLLTPLPAVRTLHHIFEEFNYQRNNVAIHYGFVDTRRRHIRDDLYAGFLGALAQFSSEGHDHYIVSIGFSFEDGSCYPSAEHVNGSAGDLRYLSTNENGERTLLNGSQFDYDNQLIFCNILIDYGFQTFSSEYFSNRTNTSTADDNQTILPNARNTTNPPHNNHLHLANFRRIRDIYV